MGMHCSLNPSLALSIALYTDHAGDTAIMYMSQLFMYLAPALHHPAPLQTEITKATTTYITQPQCETTTHIIVTLFRTFSACSLSSDNVISFCTPRLDFLMAICRAVSS